MNKTMFWGIVCLLLIGGGHGAFAAEELYLVDSRESPGAVLQVQSVSWRPTPVLRPAYIRRSGTMYSLAFHKYGYAYFLDLSHHNIYRTDGLTEETIFSFGSPIQDLDLDSRGRMFFSVASGADGDASDGVIYHLNPHAKRTTLFVRISFPAGGVVGYWNGYFAFSPSDKLFLSIDDPQPGGSSIYEYDSGQLRKRFTHGEAIAGFAFVDERTLYFTSLGNRVYELRDFSHVSVRHEEQAARMLSDVEVVRVPAQGECTISGRLHGGQSLWRETSVQALGPNVVWRTSAGSSARVAGDGTYTLRNLPGGRYRVRTDIHPDTGVGFEPQSHTINCGGQVQNIDFRFPR